MQLNITGHNVEITPAMREFVTAKFSKLEQFFDRINQVYIVLKVEKVTQIADANLHVNGGEIHASAEGQDMYAAVDGLIDKLARQLIVRAPLLPPLDIIGDGRGGAQVKL